MIRKVPWFTLMAHTRTCWTSWIWRTCSCNQYFTTRCARPRFPFDNITSGPPRPGWSRASWHEIWFSRENWARWPVSCQRSRIQGYKNINILLYNYNSRINLTNSPTITWPSSTSKWKMCSQHLYYTVTTP
jgi:hypothetical protein